MSSKFKGLCIACGKSFEIGATIVWLAPVEIGKPKKGSVHFECYHGTSLKEVTFKVLQEENERLQARVAELEEHVRMLMAQYDE